LREQLWRHVGHEVIDRRSADGNLHRRQCGNLLANVFNRSAFGEVEPVRHGQDLGFDALDHFGRVAEQAAKLHECVVLGHAGDV